jgi:hypothetical protein
VGQLLAQEVQLLSSAAMTLQATTLDSGLIDQLNCLSISHAHTSIDINKIESVGKRSELLPRACASHSHKTFHIHIHPLLPRSSVGKEAILESWRGLMEDPPLDGLLSQTCFAILRNNITK